MEELWKMQQALEAKIQALSAVPSSTSPTETKRQRDDSGSTSTSSSSASESAASPSARALETSCRRQVSRAAQQGTRLQGA